MQDNPFLTGNPVPAQDFINRRRELRRVTGRIRRYGQSSAITGEPRSGKTSLLHYLMDEKRCSEWCEGADARLFFRYLDVDTLGDDFSQADFWQRALEPLAAALDDVPQNVSAAFDICHANGYTTYTLEKLLARMSQARLRLVLLIDEFDRLLGHASLNNAEFYGSLRSLVTRSGGALALVLASRSTVSALNAATQEFSRTGSPYFNFLEEIPVRPFSKKSAEKLLNKAGERFTQEERSEILRYADGHPYYLQVAASTLWEVCNDLESEEMPVEKNRWGLAYQGFYQKVAPTIEDTWNLWSPATRKILAILVLDEIPTLLGERRFNLENLRSQLSAHKGELGSLEYRGFIRKAPELPSGWEISAKVMLMWIGNRLSRGLGEEEQTTRWLALEGWEGMFTRREKEQLVKTAQRLSNWLPRLKSVWKLFV